MLYSTDLFTSQWQAWQAANHELRVGIRLVHLSRPDVAHVVRVCDHLQVPVYLLVDGAVHASLVPKHRGAVWLARGKADVLFPGHERFGLAFGPLPVTPDLQNLTQSSAWVVVEPGCIPLESPRWNRGGIIAPPATTLRLLRPLVQLADQFPIKRRLPGLAAQLSWAYNYGALWRAPELLAARLLTNASVGFRALANALATRLEHMLLARDRLELGHYGADLRAKEALSSGFYIDSVLLVATATLDSLASLLFCATGRTNVSVMAQSFRALKGPQARPLRQALTRVLPSLAPSQEYEQIDGALRLLYAIRNRTAHHTPASPTHSFGGHGTPDSPLVRVTAAELEPNWIAAWHEQAVSDPHDPLSSGLFERRGELFLDPLPFTHATFALTTRLVRTVVGLAAAHQAALHNERYPSAHAMLRQWAEQDPLSAITHDIARTLAA